MNESKPDSKPHGDPNGGPVNHGRPPFWRNAHRDWRMWFCVIVMLFAMLVYVMTDGLRWRFSGQPPQPQQPISVPGGN